MPARTTLNRRCCCSSSTGAREACEWFGEIAKDVGGTDFEWVAAAGERARLWKARHEVYFALQAVAPRKQTIANNACVPISRLAECVGETERDIADAGLYGPILGHVGDGNFRIALMIDAGDADDLARAEAVLERPSRRALAMEGTCTGEHGIGQGKRSLLALEHGAGADVMAAIKRAIAPPTS